MQPVRVALIGCGRRAEGTYARYLPALAGLVELVAVCDPRPGAAARFAEQHGGRPYRSLRALLRDRPMEAALVVTPPDSHHALSVTLSRAGIAHLVETPMAPTLAQCRSMRDEAAQAGVLLHINEQFFRRGLVLFARELMASGVIGDVHRISCFHAHLGYHNDSIHQILCGARPVAVNALEHHMPTPRYLDIGGRWQEGERFRMRAFHFENGMLVSDQAGNIKSGLGRCPRPGYLEIDGTHGSIVEIPHVEPRPWRSRAYLRTVDDDALQAGGLAGNHPIRQRCGEELRTELCWDGDWERWEVDCHDERITLDNPMAAYGILNDGLAAAAASTCDFLRAVRGEADASFTVEHAVISAEMEAAAALSVERDGARVAWPIVDEPACDRAVFERLRADSGIDPMDVEALIDHAFPLSYDVERVG